MISVWKGVLNSYTITEDWTGRCEGKVGAWWTIYWRKQLKSRHFWNDLQLRLGAWEGEGGNTKGGWYLRADLLEWERLGIRYSLFHHFLAAELGQVIAPLWVYYLPFAKWGQSELLSTQVVKTKVNHSCKAFSLVASINLSVCLSVYYLKR